MGLDIIAYRENGETLKIFEFDEELHQIIFWNQTINWGKYPFLYLINDYYKANSMYIGKDLHSFIQELKSIRYFIPKNKHYKLDHILNCFSLNDIHKIRVIGD